MGLSLVKMETTSIHNTREEEGKKETKKKACEDGFRDWSYVAPSQDINKLILGFTGNTRPTIGNPIL